MELMENRAFCCRLLRELPFERLELKKKSFHHLKLGIDGFLWIVEEGALLTMRETDDGRIKGIGLYDAHTLIGVAGVTETDRSTTCYAMSRTVLACVPMEDFLALMARDHQLCYHFTIYISHALIESYNDIELSTLGSLEDKIASFEQRLATKHFPRDTSLSEVVTAMAVGAHPVSVNRSKKRSRQAQSYQNNGQNKG